LPEALSITTDSEIPPHLQKAYHSLNYPKGSLPIAEELADTSLSLPLYVGLEKNQISYIIETIKRFYTAHKRY